MTTHFLMGMSRAGTRWVSQCLNEHSDVAAFGETCFWGRRYLEPSVNGTYDARQLHVLTQQLGHVPYATIDRSSQENASRPGFLKQIDATTYPRLVEQALADLDAPARPADVFSRLTAAIAATEGKSVVVEKTPHHVNWIERIASQMPDSKFVIMVRNPYDFMLSYKHQRANADAIRRRAFRRLYHPLPCSFVWRGYLRAATAAVQAYPDRTLLVRFEELTRDPASTFDRIQQFLGVDVQPIADRVPPSNSSFADTHRPQLTAADLFWMNRVAGDEITQYGTEKRPVPFRPLGVGKSVLGIPWWAARNGVGLHRVTDGVGRYCWRWLAQRPCKPKTI